MTDVTPSRFTSIADAAPILMWSTGVNGQCDWFNRNWLDFTGETMESALAQGRSATVHPDDREPAMSAFMAALELRDSIELEYRLTRHDGSYCWMLDRSAPRFDASGDFAGYVGVCGDISRDYELRRCAAEREQMMQQLNDIGERERSFLSCAIHDGILQDIIGADMLMQARDGLDQDGLKAKLDRARTTLGSAINHGRRLISELRPMILDERGLISAIEFYAAELQNRGTVKIDVRNLSANEIASPLWSGNVFRIVQAAMNNIESHSESATAVIEISQANGEFRVVVSDAGVGFDAEAAHDSFGFRCMRERAGLFGGTVVIASELGKGCTVTIDIPLPPNS